VTASGKKGLGVLSLGYTLDLWDDPAEAFGDPRQGLTGYADSISYFALIAHSLHRKKLKPIQLAGNFWAYPTNAYTPVDTLLRMFFLALRLAKRNSIDLVQVRECFFSGIAGYFLTRWLKVPMHICVYGTDPFEPYWLRASWVNKLIALWAKPILRSADGVQVDGSRTARKLAESGIARERIVVKPLIPDNLDDYLVDHRDSELLAQLSMNGRFRRFALFVGRVDPQKNLQLLLDVASRLKADYADLRFIIIGDGPKRPDFERAIQEQGLSEIVTCIGFQSHRDVVRYMATCDFFVLSSVYEGFARVLMEAAMSAMPIVTTDVSGADDAVVHEKTGYIVPIGDAAAFSNALIELMEHPDRAAEMGRLGRVHIQQLVAGYSDPKMQVRIWEGVVGRLRAKSSKAS
jgi:glycosyltransferase involved in cell wall biosynthesis